jgi:chitin disaccharide deacetylase
MDLINIKAKRITLILASLLIILCTSAQPPKNLAEQLGYPKDSKLLIIHADDMGLAHSVNAACINAFVEKYITSASIMVPCPWALEITDYVKNHPGMDVGIHLTMNAEWKLYKWGGVSPSDQISSLLDKNGYFYPTVEALGKVAKGEEAERELKAQINKVIESGIQPTHIDTHMGSVLANPELVKIYLRLSEEYNLPILFPRAYLGWFPPELAKSLESKIFLIDNLFELMPPMITGKWIDPYKIALEELKPGLNEIIVHIGYDNDELKAICKGIDDYGSSWRQNDLDLVLSTEFKDLIKKNNIILIGWGQVKNVMK